MPTNDPKNSVPNVINEVLSPAVEGASPLPQPLAPTEEVVAAATETSSVHEAMAPLELDVARRRSYAAQALPSQAAVTAVCVRILRKFKKVEDRANLPFDAAKNLLRLETGLGAVRQAVWPLMRYGLTRFQHSDGTVAQELLEIDTAAAMDRGLMRVSLGQSWHVQARQDQKVQGKRDRNKKRTSKGQAAVAQNQDGLAGKRSAELVAGDITAGKVRSRLSPLPAGSKGKTKKKKG